MYAAFRRRLYDLIKADYLALEAVQHRFDAAPIRTFLSANGELYRLPWLAAPVLRVSVVCADDRHGAERQPHLRRQPFKKLRQQISFFAGQKRRQYAHDTRRVLRGGRERVANLGRDFGPRHGDQLAATPRHRPQEALLGIDVVITEPAVVAHEMALRLRIIARAQAINDILIAVQVDATAGRTIGANAVLGLEVPDAMRIEKILAAQCANRANIDHITSELVVERIARKNVDLGMIASVDDL